MSDSQWRLHLLGTYHLERSGRSVAAFGGRQDEQLLAYVALLAPTAASRRSVASLLWPHADVSTALKNLSVTLFALKKLLREAGLANGGIESVRSSLRLSPTIALDVQEFLEALARSTKATSDSDRQRALESAVSMYGSGLLPDLDISWIEPYRRQIALVYKYAIEALANPDRQLELCGLLREELPSIAWALSNEIAMSPVPDQTSATVLIAADEALLEFTREAGTGLVGPDWSEWASKLDQRLAAISMASVQAIHHNELTQAAALLVPIWRYWQIRGSASAGFALFESLHAAGYSPMGRERGDFYHAIGALAAYAGRFAEAREYLQQAIDQWRELDLVEDEIRSRGNLGITYFQESDFASALSTYEDCLSLARAIGDTDLQVRLSLDAAKSAIRIRNADKARRLLQRRLTLLESMQAAPSAAWADTWSHLAAVSLLTHDYETALTETLRAVPLFSDAGDRRGLVYCEQLLGRIAYHQGRLDDAHEHISKAVALSRQEKARWDLGVSMSFLAIVLKAQGHDEESVETMKDAERLLQGGSDAGALARAQVEVSLLQHQGAHGAPPGQLARSQIKSPLVEGEGQS